MARGHNAGGIPKVPGKTPCEQPRSRNPRSHEPKRVRPSRQSRWTQGDESKDPTGSEDESRGLEAEAIIFSARAHVISAARNVKLQPGA